MMTLRTNIFFKEKDICSDSDYYLCRCEASTTKR